MKRRQTKFHQHHRSIHRRWYYYLSRPKPLHTAGDTASRFQEIPWPGGFRAARAAAVAVAIRRQCALYQSISCSWRRLVPLSSTPRGAIVVRSHHFCVGTTTGTTIFYRNGDGGNGNGSPLLVRRRRPRPAVRGHGAPPRQPAAAGDAAPHRRRRYSDGRTCTPPPGRPAAPSQKIRNFSDQHDSCTVGKPTATRSRWDHREPPRTFCQAPADENSPRNPGKEQGGGEPWASEFGGARSKRFNGVGQESEPPSQTLRIPL